jgi:hypothetical protein
MWHVWEEGNIYTVLMGKHHDEDHLEDLGVGGRIILK